MKSISQTIPRINRTRTQTQNRIGNAIVSRKATVWAKKAFHLHRYKEYTNPAIGYSTKIKGIKEMLRSPNAIASTIIKVPYAAIIKL